MGQGGIPRNKLFLGLFGLTVNAEFNHPRYFSMHPTGENSKGAHTVPFFEVAMAQNPKPQTVAIVAADAEFSHTVAEGARANATKAGLKIVYDRSYPPSHHRFLAHREVDPGDEPRSRRHLLIPDGHFRPAGSPMAAVSRWNASCWSRPCPRSMLKNP